MRKKIPEDWKTSIIGPIYKKGDPMDCNNYRGISMLFTRYTILSKVIFNHLRPYTVDITGEYQSS